jgi:hypothetical protein
MITGDSRSLSLGSLVNFLKNIKSCLDEVMQEHDDASSKLNNIGDLPVDALEVCKTEGEGGAQKSSWKGRVRKRNRNSEIEK